MVNFDATHVEGGQGHGAGAGVYDIAIDVVLDCSHAGMDHGGELDGSCEVIPIRANFGG